ncbi:MAG: DEAD/DEAH box helicase [Firmicutes bacterium]|nr:DEAD/DEAH box helicase [Bacillota bacterium]
MTIKSFQDLPISPELIKAVEEIGYLEPTPIQKQAIPLIVEGLDITGQSQTGSGKTASFALPALDFIDYEKPANETQVLVLCPTRELVLQSAGELKKFAKYKNNIHIVTIFGGDSYERQFRQLRQGCQIIIGTPGRIMDHMDRKTLDLSNLRMLVLDEADEMLNMGFREDLERILIDVPKVRQTLMFSATMPLEILELSIKYQKDPQMVRIDQRQMTVSTLEQFYYETPRGRKKDAVVGLLAYSQPNRAMIFCNTKKMVDELVVELSDLGFPVQGIHGDLRQNQRTQIMEQFRTGKFSILVATDVAARGIDVDDVEIVINFDLPYDEEYYVHRIGRTARAGKKGQSFTLVQGKGQVTKLRQIMRYTKSKIEAKSLPTLQEIKENQKLQRLKRIEEVLDQEEFKEAEPGIKKILEESQIELDRLAAALYHLHFGLDEKLESLAGLNLPYSSSEPSGRRPEKSFKGKRHKLSKKKKYALNDRDKAVIKISIGRSDKVSVGQILSAVSSGSGVPGKLIGAITIQKTYSLVDVPKEYKKTIIKKLNNTTIKGKRVKVL